MQALFFYAAAASIEQRLGQSAGPLRRSAFRSDVDDRFGEGLRRFLGQIVPEPPVMVRCEYLSENILA
jgi:hypothetical protein